MVHSLSILVVSNMCRDGHRTLGKGSLRVPSKIAYDPTSDEASWGWAILEELEKDAIKWFKLLIRLVRLYLFIYAELKIVEIFVSEQNNDRRR